MQKYFFGKARALFLRQDRSLRTGALWAIGETSGRCFR